ncbi:MAG TPA: methyl-accepting chemotaxis protein [Thermoanaerobaculia bacterium]|nr:methyl-accepting chemotaxis protein [Thermoanaerobaculia bacterium]
MSFARRYVLWLTIPPAAGNLPLSFLFVSQVVRLSPLGSLKLLGLLVAVSAAAVVVFMRTVAPAAEEVEKALATNDSDALSNAMSHCLRRATLIAVYFWAAAGAVFSVVATWLLLPTTTGFAYFSAAALIIAFPSVVWAYAAGKRQLVSFTASSSMATQYTGKELSLGRKIAVIFIGSFIISMLVLGLLISSKVSDELENLAIASAADRFQRLHSSANVLAKVDAQALDTMKSYIPSDYSISLVREDGTAIHTGEPLDPREIEAIIRIENGDSSSYVGDHVARFAPVRDGSILVLTIPWKAYQSIPVQIAFYTLLVALVTTIVFSIATLLLARDVTAPLRRLRATAREMAAGNFDTGRQAFSDDEVGELASSFAETGTNLSRLLGRIGGSGTTITEGVRVITGGTESLLERSRSQAELTERSTSSVENVRGGIRSVLGAAENASALTEDASTRALELQASAEEVARSMDYLFQSVEKTSSSTTEMHATMNETSQRTGVLAGIGDEVLSFVSQLDSMVDELSATAEATADISRQVREDAEAGGKAVGRTVEGINQTQELTDSTAKVIDNLQQSVGSIGQMLNVIEEITGRTNLLALNAAIIAAQAGEHGLGFSVVAEEIRELAERTRGSTKEISEVVKAVQGNSRQAVAKINEGVVRVRENVALAHDAAGSLEKIVASANRSYEMATKISRALEEQAKASRHLHDVTSRMSDHIAEINRATTEQARGTELLAQESERIRDIAGQVKNATAEQSQAGRGITVALERMAADSRAMRDLLERQLQETDRIADASRTMLSIAQQNDQIARDFSETVQNLVRSGQGFENEVARFRIAKQ